MLIYDDRTRAEIDLDALDNNYRVIRGLIGENVRMMAMMKADAYGHGAVVIARELEKLGIDYLAVANIYEAAALREAGITARILILGYTPFELTKDLIDLDITQAVQSLSHAQAYNGEAAALGRKLRVHIKLDTGMSRCGIVCSDGPDSAAQEISDITSLPFLETEGIFTHFATSEADDESYAQAQFSAFLAVLDKIRDFNINIPIKHCANSGAVLKYPYMHLDMVRAGLALYGISPLPGDETFGLKPVMSLHTRIEQIKTIPTGSGVGYGVTYTTDRETRIAVLPIGYGDGLRRIYHDPSFIVRGKRAPQLGRVCMDLCMIDVTDIPEAEQGDDVVLFGAPPFPDADHFAPADDVCAYDLLTGVSKRVLRLYKRGGEIVDRMCYV